MEALSCDHGRPLTSSCNDCNPPPNFERDYGTAMERAIAAGRDDLVAKLIDGLYDIMAHPSA